MLFRSHNGVDTSIWKPTYDDDAISRMGIDPKRPYVLFVGRITRQKGLVHLLAAAHHFPPGVQIVFAASSPDEPGIGNEVSKGIAELSDKRPGDVIWLNTSVPKADLITLQTHATVFMCPSIYEPLGIVNLEAMACGTPVIASDLPALIEAVGDAAELVSPENVFDIARALRALLLDQIGRAHV